MSTITVPRFCLTLLPPWPQAIAYAGKRIENRSSGVASQLRDYRGLVGLSQSKGYSASWTEHEALDAWTEIKQNHRLAQGTPRTNIGWDFTAGRLWLVAELLNVVRPEFATGDSWHVPGQWGLVLGRVWEVEPVPCMGGQGAWRPQWCDVCKKIIADSHGLTCKTCKSSNKSGPDIPELAIVREVSL